MLHKILTSVFALEVRLLRYGTEDMIETTAFVGSIGVLSMFVF
jgi:hypothetical protein